MREMPREGETRDEGEGGIRRGETSGSVVDVEEEREERKAEGDGAIIKDKAKRGLSSYIET